MIATIATQSPAPHRASWSGFLLKELAPAPDRLNATLRIVLTCVLVVVELRRRMSATLVAVEHSVQGGEATDSDPSAQIGLYRTLVANVDSILSGGRDERVV